MKKLTRIRLVNWYHILDETIPVGGSVLFMGDNGSGKSTLLDAIQFALVADLSQMRFNQAANEQAARSLQSYTRWMTNSGGTKESHQYNRGDCTTYVLLEFSEPEGLFTIGAVVDSFKDGRDPSRLHFIANETEIAKVPVYRDGSRVPLSTTEFRQRMGTRKGFSYSRDPGPYRDNLMTRLGRLSPEFTKILVKALAFKPLGQVTQFVMDFLLDPRPLETQSLQANLASYKALEQKAKEAERRIACLERITEKNTELIRLKDEILAFDYLRNRGRAGIEEEKIAHWSASLAEATEGHRRIEASISGMKEEIARSESGIASLYRSLHENEAYRERERLKDDLVREARDADVTRRELQSLLGKRSEFLGTLEKFRILHPTLPPEVDGEALRDLAFAFRREQEKGQAELERLKAEGKELEAKLSDLRNGVRPVMKEAKILKELIEDRLHCGAPFLCELLEVDDEKWQGAVEGYLNTRRFDLVVEPKVYARALRLYEEEKRQMGIHSVGLVDVEKFEQGYSGARAGHARAGSLAEVISSDHSGAKAYADFLMGDTMRCESERELRKYSRAITTTCMVYQNHAARQTPFHVFDTWFIGKRGTARLIERTEAEINALFEKFKTTADAISRAEKLRTLAERAEKLWPEVEKVPAVEQALAECEREIERLSGLMQAVSTDEIQSLEKEYEKLRTAKTLLEGSLEAALRASGDADRRILELKSDIEEASKQRDLVLAELSARFGGDEGRLRAKEFEGRYGAELAKGRGPYDVVRIYDSSWQGRQTQSANVLEQLAALRSDYNNLFGFAAAASGEDVSPYLAELHSWKTSLLPDYLERIAKAKDAALQQLMEDIVHKLRENLDRVPSQFEQINRALRGFHFGLDQYQFSHRVKRDFEPFYKMIQEAARYEKQPLFETNWRERFRSGGALEALFTSLVSGSSMRVQEELQQYSDYRQYFDYDLEIRHSDGSISYYSQVNRWKSGGETQTPYYIAVLASLYRLYRLQPESSGKKDRGTIGLVLLDEAFNKMDESHLRATLEFTRKLGLQLVMATPKERAEFIIPQAESCWIVMKDPQTGHAFLLDYHQDLADEAESSIAEVGASGDESTLVH